MSLALLSIVGKLEECLRAYAIAKDRFPDNFIA